MAADLAIHVFAEGELTVENFRCFFGSTLGSKWGPQLPKNDPPTPAEIHAFQMSMFRPEFMRHCKSGDFSDTSCEARISKTEQCWVGEVSWLKADLSGDPDTYIPGTVMKVHDIIGEVLPVIDTALIEKIRGAFKVENTTSYDVTTENAVVEFLTEHKGKRAFTVSW